MHDEFVKLSFMYYLFLLYKDICSDKFEEGKNDSRCQYSRLADRDSSNAQWFFCAWVALILS